MATITNYGTATLLPLTHDNGINDESAGECHLDKQSGGVLKS